MTTNYALKPFVINLGDIQFLLDQVNFRPLFNAAGELLFNWDGSTAIYATAQGAAGTLLYMPPALPDAVSMAAALAEFGQSYYSVADAAGVRDVSGVANNLDPAHALWGAADLPFIGFANPEDLGYGNYLTPDADNALNPNGNVADYEVTGSGTTINMQDVIDYTPRMITQTIMTAGVKFLTEEVAGPNSTTQNHIVYWDPQRYIDDLGFKALIDSHGIDTGKLIEGAAVIDMMADNLGIWTAQQFALGQLVHALGLSASNTSGTIDLGGDNVITVEWNATTSAALDYWQLLTDHGVDTSSLVEGSLIADPLADSPYGLLEALGVQDQQNPDNGEYFIEAANPGVAPTNGFFAVFGQFFDHGLDFIGKGGNQPDAKITIPLSPDDPLYGVLGQDGQPTTTITISRATVDHIDENGVPQYINHTSPFIDQSQTYGSTEQVTQILREWVEDPNNPGTFIAGARLFDGKINQEWTDGFGNTTTSTLPTLAELREHIAQTGRSELTWEDVLNLRIRDANGQLVDVDAGLVGVQTAGSGHALLLDMNPKFDAAQLLADDGNATTTWDAMQSSRVSDAVATLSANVQATTAYLDPGHDASGDTFGFSGGVLTLHLGSDLNVPGMSVPLPAGDYSGASAMALWISFKDFSIMAPPGAIHDAVSEIMMASVGDHYLAGDGRVNENVALTSIHHVFHMEHGYQAQNLAIAITQQDATLNDPTHQVLHDWQVAVHTGADNIANATNAFVGIVGSGADAHWEATGGILARNDDGDFYVVANGTLAGDLPEGHSLVKGRDGAFISAEGSYTDANGYVSWSQDKLFQGTKLVVEMEYQHTAVDQYARAVSPDIPEFSAYSTDIDSTISMAYAQGAFRFGHSTLRETIDTMDPDGGITGQIMSYALEKAFLNPDLYAEVGASSLVLGMTHQVMNDVDEFITPALQQGLLGLPMDLAAINIARGRDVGLPTLNQARGLLGLQQYSSWSDFGQHLFHIESLVNFIAAYSFDGDTTRAQAVLDATSGVINTDYAESSTLQAAIDFLNGGNLDFNKIDLWIGGLAEQHISGGLLGETFNVVFVDQIQRLMDGDRFYYLYRLAGTQFGDEIINEQFKDMVERTTGTTHLNGNVFGYSDQYYEMSNDATSVETQGEEHAYGQTLAEHPGIGIYTNGGTSTAGNGTIVTIDGQEFVADFRPDLQPNTANTDGSPVSGAGSGEVLAGTDFNDLIHLGGGDDSGYAEGGNDTVYGDLGFDRIYGGAGNDYLDGGDQPDVVDGGDGDDIVIGGDSGSSVAGFDQLIGGAGSDTIYGGIGIDKIYGNLGDDVIYGGADTDPFIFGGDGMDIVDGGDEQDNVYGNDGDDLLIGGADKDILFGQAGDDILRPGTPAGSANPGGGNTGNNAFGPDEVVGGDGNVNAVDTGFDLVDMSDNGQALIGAIDLNNQQNPNTNLDQNQVMPTMFEIDGAIGTQGGDVILGDAAGNWLIGGSGNDSFDVTSYARPDGSIVTVAPERSGNDIIVGGSIRLDKLIGSYQLNGQADTYSYYDGLAGASHRVDPNSVLAGGLLDAAALQENGQALFEKHFTDMLQAAQFKDMMLGDGGTDGASDLAQFSGNWTDYEIVALREDGTVIDQPDQHLAEVFALKITDNGDGVRTINDGTDLVIGVDQFRFADGDRNLLTVLGQSPVLDLHAFDTGTYRDTFSASSYANSNGTEAWTTAWSEGTTDPAGGSAQTGGQVRISGGALSFSDNGNGAVIERVVDLSGASSATLSFTYAENSFDNGETVQVSISKDGTTFHTLTTLNSTSNNGSFTADISGFAEAFGANAVLRFEVISNTSGNGTIAIDNVNFDVVRPLAVPMVDYAATFTENQGPLSISQGPLITDDGTTLASAQVVLTNAQNGDDLLFSAVAGITITKDVSVAGIITLTLTGEASLAAYEAAIAGVRFANASDNPGTIDRVIETTLNDGNHVSAVATTTIDVVAVNDAPVADDDYVFTNLGSTGIVVPQWALLANDTDPDGTTLTLTSVSNPSSLTVTNNVPAGSVTINDTGNISTFLSEGSFNYTVNDGVLTDNGSVVLERTTSNTVNGSSGLFGLLSNRSDILIGSAGSSTFNAYGGNDIVMTGAGSDTVDGGSGNDNSVWFVGDGRDRINGGDNTDTFTVNGLQNTSETFRIYAVSGGTNAAQRIALALQFGTTFNSATEIIVTRQEAGGVEEIVAELDNIEELVINGDAITSGSTTAAGDDVQIAGDFTATSLALNTIHVNGGAGDDTVDITGLTSEHRVVFHSGAGNDGITGDVRDQDVMDDLTMITLPGLDEGDCDDDEHGLEHQTPDGGPLDGTTDGDALVGGDLRDTLNGLDGDDTLIANDGNDDVNGGQGSDRLMGMNGRDHLVGSAGNDLIFGGQSSDTIAAGTGNDTVFGGNGDDLIIAIRGDGNDDLYGDAASGPQYSDTLDMSRISANIAADLGTGGLSSGVVVSTQSGIDQIWGIENIITGSGEDVITASAAVNVMDGGAGNDIYRFRSAAEANGDTITSFAPGDRIDLSQIDGDEATAGHQGFTLVSGGLSGAVGELSLTFETRTDGEYTVILGNTTGDATEEFKISIKGHHDLQPTDFVI